MKVAVRGLSTRLSGRTILTDVDLTVPPGSWTAIIGPNGAGKSTLLRSIVGLLRGDGEITVDGRDPRALPPRERARMLAYAPQNPMLPPGMSVFDYALLGRSPFIPYLGRESRNDRTVAAEALERLGLTGLADRDLDRLSGGERQRVVLARALTQRAPVLFLDEPTTALDIGHQQQVMELIDELRADAGLTVVTTIHDLTLAAQYADALVLISGGRVAADGAPGDVLTRATVAEHFGASVRVTTGRDGRPSLTLERPC